jgi:hypothetical protein
MLKSLIWWNLLEKREAFLFEKALKKDICAIFVKDICTLRANSII